jgi:hypothetical protein
MAADAYLSINDIRRISEDKVDLNNEVRFNNEELIDWRNAASSDLVAETTHLFSTA